MELHPQLIERKGKNEFVVLPYKEFLVLEEIVQDYEDLRDLREAKEEFKNQPAIPLDEVINSLGL